MPGMSGADLHRQLADQRAELPATFTSGWRAWEPRESTPKRLLPKPFRLVDLAELVRKTLDAERQPR